MQTKNKLIVISAIGKDLTGLVGILTSVIFQNNCNIVDIKQSVAHGFFSIFIIVDTSNLKIKHEDFIKKIHDVGNETGLKIIIEKFQEGRRKSEKKIMSAFLAGKDKPGVVATVTTTLSNFGINVEYIKMIARGEIFLMKIDTDLSDISTDFEKVKSILKETLIKMNVGISFDAENENLNQKKLIALDIANLDYNIIFGELNKLLPENIKLNDKSLCIEKIAKLLKGLNVNFLNKIYDNLQVTADIEEIIRDFKNFGFKVAIISPCFKIIIDKLKKLLNIEYAFSNNLLFDKKTLLLTGEVEKPLLDFNKRNEIIKFICKSEDIEENNVIYLDGLSNAESTENQNGLFFNFNKIFLSSISELYEAKNINSDNLQGIIQSFNISY